MPFIYPKQKRKIEIYNTRDFQNIDQIVREALEEVEEWGHKRRGTGIYHGKEIYLLNNLKWPYTSSDKEQPNKFLVSLCLIKELNLGEIEKWLDDTFLNSHEFHYDKSSIMHVDLRRMYYEAPKGKRAYGGGPCTLITWYPNRK